ncbi:MAG: hypothetical protein RLZZ297_135, partial [Chloroflexota bacterium]
FTLALEQRSALTTHLKSLGYTYVTLDLAGFRSGSMNETKAPKAQEILLI